MKHTKLAIFWTLAILIWSSYSFAVTTSMTKVTPSQVITNSTTITFEFISDAADAYFMCSLDNREPVHCTSPWSYNNLPDGQHRLKVMAISPTLGPDRVGVVYNWLIDTVPPQTFLKANPIGQDAYSVDLFSSETNSTFVCSIDNSAAFACRTPHVLQGFLPGRHDFKAFAVDEAGNVDPVGADFAFSVVSAQPLTTSITHIDPASNYTNINQITFDFIASQAAASFVCSLAGASGPCIPPYHYAHLPDGNYVFKVQAVDAFGNIDPVGASYPWTVDTTPPVGVLTKLDTTSTIFTVTWTTNEPATTELHWGPNQDLSRSAGVSTQLTTVHSVQVTGLSSNSPYSLQPAGVDRAGNFYQMNRLSLRTKR